MHVPLGFVWILPVVWYKNESVASPALLGPVPVEDFSQIYPTVLRIWCKKKFLYSVWGNKCSGTRYSWEWSVCNTQEDPELEFHSQLPQI